MKRDAAVLHKMDTAPKPGGTKAMDPSRQAETRQTQPRPNVFNPPYPISDLPDIKVVVLTASKLTYPHLEDPLITKTITSPYFAAPLPVPGPLQIDTMLRTRASTFIVADSALVEACALAQDGPLPLPFCGDQARQSDLLYVLGKSRNENVELSSLRLATALETLSWIYSVMARLHNNERLRTG